MRTKGRDRLLGNHAAEFHEHPVFDCFQPSKGIQCISGPAVARGLGVILAEQGVIDIRPQPTGPGIDVDAGRKLRNQSAGFLILTAADIDVIAPGFGQFDARRDDDGLAACRVRAGIALVDGLGHTCAARIDDRARNRLLRNRVE